MHLARYPVCEAPGCDAIAQDVHHIKPLSEGGTNEAGNLMSLCHSCHSRITGSMKQW